MNSIFTICIFGAIFMQTVALDRLTNITSAENTVSAIVDDLTQYHMALKLNFDVQSKSIKSDAMSQMKKIVRLTLLQEKNAISVPNIVVTNTEHCHESLSQHLNDHVSEAYGALDNCVNDRLDTLKSMSQIIEMHLNSKNMVLSKLHSITKKCTSENIVQNRLCVVKQISKVNSLVQKFSRTAEILKTVFDSLSRMVQSNARNCSPIHINSFNGNVSSSQDDFAKCVEESKDYNV